MSARLYSGFEHGRNQKLEELSRARPGEIPQVLTGYDSEFIGLLW